MVRTNWKIMCANQQVCPEVRDKLTEIGFEFKKQTPNSADSDLIMEINIDKKEIATKGQEVLQVCGRKVQQLLVNTV